MHEDANDFWDRLSIKQHSMLEGSQEICEGEEEEYGEEKGRKLGNAYNRCR